MTDSLEVVGIRVGPLLENVWLVGSPATERALVVDPGDEAERIFEEARRRGWSVERIVLTHGHADHICAAPHLHRLTGAPIAGPPGDTSMLADPVLSGAVWLGYDFEPVTLDESLNEGAPWTALGREWGVLHTPGHTPGHISIYSPADRVLFSGDVLFAGGVGRSDLPGGSSDALARSIREKLLTLPDDTRVFPGHGPETSIGRERMSNPYVEKDTP